MTLFGQLVNQIVSNYATVLTEVVTAGTESYARPEIGAGRKVNVEFVSANPNGPLHAGHGRGAAYGDSLARILERTGHDVTREFYLKFDLSNLKTAIKAGKGFNPSDFGEVIAAGKGEPPNQVRAEVASMYQVLDSMAPPQAAAAPIATEKKAWDEY